MALVFKNYFEILVDLVAVELKFNRTWCAVHFPLIRDFCVFYTMVFVLFIKFLTNIFSSIWFNTKFKVFLWHFMKVFLTSSAEKVHNIKNCTVCRKTRGFGDVTWSTLKYCPSLIKSVSLMWGVGLLAPFPHFFALTSTQSKMRLAFIKFGWLKLNCKLYIFLFYFIV